MKLLILGNANATGFGTVTADLGRALLAQGVDVRFFSWNPVGGDLPEPFAERTVHISSGSTWVSLQAAKSKLEHIMDGSLFEDRWTPDRALILGDVGSMIAEHVTEWFPADLPAWHYAPVEGAALPPAWREWWSRFHPIAMSEFGATELEALMGERPPMVYHGVDTDAFYPVSANHPITWRSDREMVVIRSKAEAKRAFGMPPDSVFIFRADQNVVRKAYFELFLALAPVVERYPQVIIGVHCRTRDFGGDLDDMLSHIPPHLRTRMGQLDVSRKFGHAGQVMPREVLAALYNAADIYVSNSCEGFGLTIAEALACGVPAVGMDWSAVPEVIGKAGITVPIGRLYPNIYSHFWATADGEKLAEAVTSLIRAPGARRRLGALGPIHVGALFQWVKAASQFGSIMEPVKAMVAA